MSKMDDACREVVAQCDGATACCVVDLDTGMVLGSHSDAGYERALVDLVAVTAVELFRGPHVSQIESMVRAHHHVTEDGEHYVKEVYLASDHSAHFARTIREGRAVLMLTTAQSTNMGMSWAQLRAAVPGVEGLVP